MHSKYQLFNINASTPNFNGIDLLATASTFGLVIVGKPSAQEIQGLKRNFYRFFFYSKFDALWSDLNIRLCTISLPVRNSVLQLKDVVANKESSSVPVRSINIPGEPYILALSCDHTMLSVCYTANGMTFMDVYAVQSFLSSVSLCQTISWFPTFYSSK